MLLYIYARLFMNKTDILALFLLNLDDELMVPIDHFHEMQSLHVALL